jgi:hypothetical protein
VSFGEDGWFAEWSRQEPIKAKDEQRISPSAPKEEVKRMAADAALFIGWGQVVRGREKRAVQVFNESVEYWGGLQGDGKIQDFEVVLLTPHGGDLQGFALVRGSQEQIGALRADEEFARRVARADQIVESQGVVDAVIGEGIGREMATYQSEVDDLG